MFQFDHLFVSIRSFGCSIELIFEKKFGRYVAKQIWIEVERIFSLSDVKFNENAKTVEQLLNIGEKKTKGNILEANKEEVNEGVNATNITTAPPLVPAPLPPTSSKNVINTKKKKKKLNYFQHKIMRIVGNNNFFFVCKVGIGQQKKGIVKYEEWMNLFTNGETLHFLKRQVILHENVKNDVNIPKYFLSFIFL